MILRSQLEKMLMADLAVDRIQDDVTTRLLGVERARKCRAQVTAKSRGVFCGRAVALAMSRIFAEDISAMEVRTDGEGIERGDTVLMFSTSVERALTLERTLLNMITHLSGVATATRSFVEAVKPFPAKILATRKTLPGLRDLQLTAVVAGGGFIHRRNLSDGILIKDNHIAAVGIDAVLNSAEQVRSPLHRVEIEVQNLEQLDQVLAIGADVIMLDNFELPMLQEGIQRVREKTKGRTKIEVSGGVTLESVRSIAELGVDYISVGALTHSVSALNMSLDLNVER